MKKTVVLLFVLLSAVSVAQAPGIQWQNSYGGSSYEFARKILAAYDGGYLRLSETLSNVGEVIGSHGQNDVFGNARLNSSSIKLL